MRWLILFLVVGSATAATAETGSADHTRPAAPAKPVVRPAAASSTTKPPQHPHGKPAKPNTKPTAKPATKPADPAPHPAAPPAPAPDAAPVRKPYENRTGLTVPRFAALGSDTVNFRVGPDEKSPILWIYKRRDLPIKILRDYYNWRLVEDPEGDKGWVHALTLTGRRSGMTVAGPHTLRDAASDTGGAIAKLNQGVIVRIRSCEAASDWCRVTVGDYAGYMKRADIWGILPGEVIQ